MPTLGWILIGIGALLGVLVWLWTRRRSQAPEVVATGLRAIDLFVPLPRGGTVLVTGDGHAGVRILGTELAYRLAHFSSQPFRVVIYLDSELAELETVCQELREVAPEIKTIFVTSAVTTEDVQSQRRLASPAKQDAIFAFGRSAAFVQAFTRTVQQERQHPATSASLTAVAVAEGMPGEGFDAHIVLSSVLAQEAIYPALDLRRSQSAANLLPRVRAGRQPTADAARETLCAIQETIYPGALNDPEWLGNRDPAQLSAVQALRFLSQPFFVAQLYTGQTAAYVPVEQARQEFQRIVSNQLPGVSPRSFLFRNALPAQSVFSNCMN